MYYLNIMGIKYTRKPITRRMRLELIDYKAEHTPMFRIHQLELHGNCTEIARKIY